MENNEFNAIFSILSILGLLYLIFWRYKTYRIDVFRQDIFELRDKLFDYAQSGNIDYNHPSYGTLRSLMNGFIRFGHQISFCQLITISIIMKNKFSDTDSFSKRWNTATSDLDVQTKGYLDKLLLEVHSSIIKHLILTSPFMLATIILPIILFFLSKHFILKLNKIYSKRGNNIDSVAYAYGSI